MEKKGSYVGKITNKGAQEVKAPLKQPASKSPKVHTGGDLKEKKSAK